MDNSKTNATLKGVQDLQGEISSWQHRLDFVKTEKAKLDKQCELLREEVKNISATMDQANAQKYSEMRATSKAIEDSRSKLEADKAEFVKALTDLKQQKNAFERERQDSLDAKKNADDITNKVGAFVRLMKAEANKL